MLSKLSVAKDAKSSFGSDIGENLAKLSINVMKLFVEQPQPNDPCALNEPCLPPPSSFLIISG